MNNGGSSLGPSSFSRVAIGDSSISPGGRNDGGVSDPHFESHLFTFDHLVSAVVLSFTPENPTVSHQASAIEQCLSSPSFKSWLWSCCKPHGSSTMMALISLNLIFAYPFQRIIPLISLSFSISCFK